MEQFANNAQTTLSGSINNSITSLTVASSSGFPSGGNFRILIESELLKVTAVSGTTWTVTRGDGGTTAASHSSGVYVTQILTKEAIDSVVCVQNSGSEISNRRILNFTGATVTDNSTDNRVDISISSNFVPPLGMFGNSTTVPPVVSNWTIFGSPGSVSPIAGGVLDLTNGGISYSSGAQSGDHLNGAYVSLSPGSAGSFTALLGVMCPYVPNTGNYEFGIIISDGTKFILWGPSRVSGAFGARQWSNNSTRGSSIGTWSYNNPPGGILWLRIKEASGTRYYDFGFDGAQWLPALTESSSTYLTVSYVGFAGNAGNQWNPVLMPVFGWKQS